MRKLSKLHNLVLKKLLITIFIVGAIIASFFTFKYSSQYQSLKIKLPAPKDVSGNTSFSCKSLAYSGLFGVSDNEIEGELHEGTDQVAMNIKDEKTLSFLTAKSVTIGVSEGDNFHILQNDNEKLMAAYYNQFAISTVTLNKKTGLAVWLKGSPDFIGSNSPNGQIIYLSCR